MESANNRDHWEMPRPEHVLEAIERWRSLDLTQASSDQIEQEMRSLRTSIGRYASQSRDYNPKYVWRIRKKEKGKPLQETIRSKSHLLNPPHAPLNRCNKTERAVLYVAEDPATAFAEQSVANGEEICLINIGVQSNIRVARIVGSFHPRNTERDEELFSQEGLVSYQILREFLRSEFTKPVPPNASHLYRISAAICSTWFESRRSDGWLYPSVQRPGAINLALKPSALIKTGIASAHLGRMRTDEGFPIDPEGLTYPGIVFDISATAKLSEKDGISWEECQQVARILEVGRKSVIYDKAPKSSSLSDENDGGR